MTSRRGRVAVIGAGPAGMATALSVHQGGHEVKVVGGSASGEILKQLAAIDAAEHRFAAVRGRPGTA